MRWGQVCATPPGTQRLVGVLRNLPLHWRKNLYYLAGLENLIRSVNHWSGWECCWEVFIQKSFCGQIDNGRIKKMLWSRQGYTSEPDWHTLPRADSLCHE